MEFPFERTLAVNLGLGVRAPEFGEEEVKGGRVLAGIAKTAC